MPTENSTDPITDEQIDTYMDTLQNNLRDFIERKIQQFHDRGLEQQDCANFLGISPSFVSQLKAGKRVGLRAVWQIAIRTGICPCEILGIHDKRTSIIIQYVTDMTEQQKTTLIRQLAKESNLIQ
jgi:transcriptional regulator with XRE-family HTH domain